MWFNFQYATSSVSLSILLRIEQSQSWSGILRHSSLKSQPDMDQVSVLRIMVSSADVVVNQWCNTQKCRQKGNAMSVRLRFNKSVLEHEKCCLSCHYITLPIPRIFQFKSDPLCSNYTFSYIFQQYSIQRAAYTQQNFFKQIQLLLWP